ncbi:reticulocalbin-2-like Protein [Elysia marginata]|uniref:Reticulocalbin-2-like Protein n=1 Tax=Elysia marginata TaxID=1093978 RepID=A0AAV4GUT0_9GAST|nr:reticulocalbin-2-like Protein [Elysia marginata]
MGSLCQLRLVVAVAFFLAITYAVPETHRHAPHKTDHHLKDGSVNPVFDQEALLGSHKMDDLADLPDDVRLKRLRNLAKSHDANNNDIIEVEELKAWLMESFRMLDKEEAMEKLEEEDSDQDGKLTFDELLDKQYGYTREDVEKLKAGEHGDDEEDVYGALPKPIELGRRETLESRASVTSKWLLSWRWASDLRAVKVMRETAGVNTCGQRRLVSNYFSISCHTSSFNSDVGDHDEENRIASETNFEELDKDKDGKLTSEELRPYAMPDNTDVAAEEADHLLSMCDEDKDGKLSIEEIVAKEDEFVSSSATDYGRTLHFVRDEL